MAILVIFFIARGKQYIVDLGDSLIRKINLPIYYMC